MDNKQTVIFEHPLHEKMRTWLRIEFLFRQLDERNALLFFHSLAELLEIIERNDIRNDLVKDIEEQKQKLIAWRQAPGIDILRLDPLIAQINVTIQQFTKSAKTELSLKDQRLISLVRKRLSIPGGCCSFDLPCFHLWLQLPQPQRDKQVAEWLTCVATLKKTLFFYLQLIRELCVFHSFSCSGNFHQNSAEAANMLRIKIAVTLGYYPQVSGNASRYAIRFVPLEELMLEARQEKPTLFFELASC